MEGIDQQELERFISLALDEDVKDGDHTSLATIDPQDTSTARLIVKDRGVIAGVAFANDNPMDTAVGTAQNVTDTWIADDDLHVTSYSSAITIAGSPAAGELVVFQLSRDVAADDLGVDAEVVGVLLEYSTDASNSS